MRSLYIAATGMKALQTNLDVISNNLANVNTTGFKRGRADFEDLLYQSARPVGASTSTSTELSTGVYFGHGVRLASTSKLFTQGSATYTENWTDMEIEGTGFFQVLLPDGRTAYTRDGAFKLNSSGILTTSDGNPVIPTITVPSTAVSDTISVSTDGIVTYQTAASTASVQAGQITLASFINPAGLQAVGSNLFLETSASGTPTVGNANANGLGAIQGGYLEVSNVNIVDELVAMIVGQRAYEVNSKAITTADQMLQTANEVKR
jgi:flagellar basal-body rod protein FlgG